VPARLCACDALALQGTLAAIVAWAAHVTFSVVPPADLLLALAALLQVPAASAL
jgi:hypothetical protein